jgi:hypothetical protein
MPDKPATTTSSVSARAGATAQNISDRSTKAVENAKIKTPVGDAPILPLLLIGLGGYLMWFAVKYWRDANVHYPSDPVKSILQGHGLPAHVAAATVTAQLNQAIATAQAAAPAAAGAAGAGGVPGAGPYTHSQLETIWKLAGGSPAKADIAAAIAQAESAGQPKVTSSNPDGGTNVGLWQLDTKGKGTGHTIAQLQNPSTNARVAVAGSSNGNDWSAWQTYAQGTYRQYLAGAPADQGSTVPTG